jgi:phosphatidate cytidylyltransferase
MAGADLITPPAARSALGSRVVVGVFLAVLAVIDIWFGGIAFALMIWAGVSLIFWEWSVMHRTPRRWRAGGLLALAAASLLAHLARPLPALMLLLAAVVALIALSMMVRASGKRWLSTGLVYAGVPAVALIWLRQQPDGFALVIGTMGVVWATDTCAYFAGRAIGGPKLWPALSPNKTWAGLGGGMAGAALFAIGWALATGWPTPWPLLALVGAMLAAAAQAGDLFESWLKRRAGVKDSGTLLRSHGGIMDRVDGLVPVSVLVAAWVAHGGEAMHAAAS